MITLTLFIVLYLVPFIICSSYLYVFWKRLDREDNREAIFFIIACIVSILPVTNIIMAFFISVVFIFSKRE